jgi:hypothetical protein
MRTWKLAGAFDAGFTGRSYKEGGASSGALKPMELWPDLQPAVPSFNSRNTVRGRLLLTVQFQKVPGQLSGSKFVCHDP